MKHFQLCNDVLLKKKINIEDLTEFIIDYGIIQNKPDLANYIQIILQLIELGYIDIIYIIKEYTRLNDKQFYSIIKNGTVIKQWIE